MTIPDDPDRAALVAAGFCPYETSVGGWGEPQPAWCGEPRSPWRADWPWCSPHAALVHSNTEDNT